MIKEWWPIMQYFRIEGVMVDENGLKKMKIVTLVKKQEEKFLTRVESLMKTLRKMASFLWLVPQKI